MGNETQATYVEVLYPGSFFPEEDLIKVTKRDPAAIAKKYPRCFCFQFFDLVSKEVEIDGEKQRVSGKRKNLSPKYYPGATVMTADDLRKLDGDYGILISNMRSNGWPAVVRCRQGNFQPFNNGDQILESQP